MAGEALIATGTLDDTASRPAGWVDRLCALPLRLPGVPAIWWVGLFVLMVVVPAGILWATGAQPAGAIDPRILVSAVLGAYGIALRNVLDGIARRALRDFMPALQGEHDRVTLESALVSVPDRVAIGAVALAEVIGTIGYLSGANEAAHLRSRPFVEQAVILSTHWLTLAITGVLLIVIFRQLATVSRLHRLAVVDLLDPGPAQAFARLTSASAIGVMLYTAILLADPAAGSDTILFGLQVGVFVLILAVAFWLPLRGMHDRLAAEKARLLRAVNGRIKVTTERLHAAVDADERSAGSGLHDQLESLIAERELIARLSTWPWGAGTLPSLGTALLIPIVVWTITRVLERYL